MNEIDIQEVLKYMREWAGVLVQENAILKAQLEKQQSTANS